MANSGLSFEILMKCAEYISSNKTKTRTITSPVETFLTSKVPKYAKSLNYYESACQEDPDLKSFDSSLHKRTSKCSGKNAPLDSLNEVCQFQGDLSRDVVKIITDNKEYFLSNEEMNSLVDLYFEITTKTLNLFNTVEKCVKKADIIPLLIRVAIKEFERELVDTKYVETLEKLNKVKAMEDPFSEEFETQYESIFDEQVMLLDKLRDMQVMLEKKHTLCNCVTLCYRHINMFYNIYISDGSWGGSWSSDSGGGSGCSCGGSGGSDGGSGVSDGGPGCGSGGGGACGGAYGGAYGCACNDHQTGCNCREMGQCDVEGLCKVCEDAEKIVILLKTVEVDFGKKEEEAVKLVMQEIIQKVEVFDEKIKQAGAHVAECSESVVSGRDLVLKHIANSASSKGK